jgi:hypothetical protein
MTCGKACLYDELLYVFNIIDLDISSGFIIFIIALICFQKCNTTASQCKHALTVTFNVNLSYAVLLIESKDQEGQSQVLSAALEVCLMLFLPGYNQHITKSYFVNWLHQFQ